MVLLLLACSQDQGITRINAAPEVAIAAPVAGELLTSDAVVVAVGSVDDDVDPAGRLDVAWTLDGAAIDARADADGAVSLTLDALAIGSHTLTLAATDLEGATGSASVTFDVRGPWGAPTVTITEPGDGASFGPDDTITFRGFATDLTTAAEDLQLDWSSDTLGPLAGAVSGGGESILLTLLPVGTHVVTLAATDADGEVGSASITVAVVNAPPEPVEPSVGDIIVSELMIQPQTVDDELGEWFELYNVTDAPLDISGYTIGDEDVDHWTLQDGLVIEPEGYLVICASLDTRENGGIACDAWFNRDYQGGGLALANSPDEVLLARPNGEVIDVLRYDDDWAGPGTAIAVDPDWATMSGNDDLGHWCFQRTVMANGETGTPGARNDDCDP